MRQKHSINTVRSPSGKLLKIIEKKGGDVILEDATTGKRYVILESLLSENVAVPPYAIREIYAPLGQNVPQGKREETNRKILDAISKGLELKKETIYNLYTGIGWLHDLDFNDFESFHDYTQAKQEFESGQFFTPPEYAKALVSILRPTATSRVIELGCGAGAFCNFLPEGCDYFGSDIDDKAIAVAKKLYGDRFSFDRADMREITAEKHGLFDIAIGNPPFNLRLHDSDAPTGRESLSQDIYLRKVHKMLAPLGIAGFIVPAKWMQDSMTHKRMMEFVLDEFYVVGQFSLPKNAFKAVGVESFETKVMVLQKKSPGADLSYANQPKTVEEFANMPLTSIEERESTANLRMMFNFESDTRTLRRREIISANGRYQLSNINISENLKFSNMRLLNVFLTLSEEQQQEVKDLWEQLRTQSKPEGMDYAEWEKIRMTVGKVYGRIKQLHYRNTHPPRKLIALVHKSGKFEAIGYDNLTFRIANEVNERFDMTDSRVVTDPSLIEQAKELILDALDGRLDEYEVQFPNHSGTIRKKTKVRDIVRGDADEETKEQNRKAVDALDLGDFIFGLDPVSGQDYSYHRDELIDSVHKPYKFLNWDPGVGKTVFAINWAKIKGGRTLVISNSLAIKATWKTMLPKGRLNPVILTPSFLRQKLLGTLGENDVCLLTSESAPDCYKLIPKGFFKNIIMDESEVQIKNPFGLRSKAVMTLRSKAKNKMLMSGTLTRNNVAELYNQLAFVFNNSYMMTNEAETMYYLEEMRGKSWKADDSATGNLVRVVEEMNERTRLVERTNPNKGEPIPYKAGYRMFQRMFSPAKPSVFGVAKQWQSLFNVDAFNLLTKWVMSYRKQARTIQPQQIQVEMTPNEKELYFDVVNEFQKFVSQIYNIQTTDSRKKALSMISLQINALFKSTSSPMSFPGYKGGLHAKAVKIIEMVRERKGQKIIIGTNWKTSNRFYRDLLEKECPGFKVFYIDGETVTIENRQKIADQFCKHDGGAIIIATTQSMQNSISIPNTDAVIVESLMWNYAQFVQFYSRGIRANSPKTADVFYLATNRSLEQNLIGLIVNKHELTSFVNTGRISNRDEIISQLGVTSDYMDEIVNMVDEELADGRTMRKLDWGKAKITQSA